jgi:diketogulonate reductase-like aldo/keto reductase
MADVSDVQWEYVRAFIERDQQQRQRRDGRGGRWCEARPVLNGVLWILRTGANRIHPIGFSPIGSPGRPERDRTPVDTSPTEDLGIRQIAQRLGVHPAVVCIKWAVRRGQVPIPFSTNPRNILSNLVGATGEPLTQQDMDTIAKLDRDCRLIKGQIFLWKDNQPWEDLWDVNGVVTPP